MPLRCIDPEHDISLQAFDLTADEWRAIEADNRARRHLRLPCCASHVVLRTSPRGTRYFAHKQTNACAGSGESETHRHLKTLVAQVARAHGWTAETEFSGQTPTGEPWVADVFAQRGDAKLAFEIQWSPQTNAETVARQARYAASKVRCLWLFRQRSFPCSSDIPAVQISGHPSEGFLAITADGDQRLPLEEFLAAAFARRFRFGLPVGIEARLSASVGNMHCWSCGAETRILTHLTLYAGPREFVFSVPDFTQFPALFDEVRLRFSNELPLPNVKWRWSKTQGRTYLSNGCEHCGTLIGEFFEHEAWPESEPVAEVQLRIDEAWAAAVRARFDDVLSWGIYARGQDC